LITNEHVAKDAAQLRLVTSAGLISAKVKVDAANDLALLKITNEEGRMKNAEIFKPLPIAASRGVKLGGTVATVGFPNIGLQGFAPKPAKGRSRRCPARGMTRGISRSGPCGRSPSGRGVGG
jgi:hypothetical protein